MEPVQYSDNSSGIHHCVELEHSSSSNNSSLINPVVGLELSSSSNNSVASNSNFCYSTVKNYSKPPFYCTCTNKSFETRQFFKSHMKKHNIEIADKMVKRKADAIETDYTIIDEYNRYEH